MSDTPKKTKKDQQHIIPRVYLKHFRISKNQNFVYCINFADKYNKGVQTVGLKDKIFKSGKYYNDFSLVDPYIIENMLGEDLEPVFNQIIKEISLEEDLSQDIRQKIILWLVVSKSRSPVIRESIARQTKFMLETIAGYEKREVTGELKMQIDEYAKRTAKRIQLKYFTDMERIEQSLALYKMR